MTSDNDVTCSAVSREFIQRASFRNGISMGFRITSRISLAYGNSRTALKNLENIEH